MAGSESLLPRTVALLALFLLVPSPITALTRPVAPSSIKAGTDTVLHATTVPADYTRYVHYNAYLAASTPDGGRGPICLLANQTAIPPASKDGHIDITVNIPASVGPAGGDAYRIAMQAFSNFPDPNEPGNASAVLYSDRFSLDGGSAQWSKYESEPSPNGMAHFLTFAGLVPCAAYDCTRQCSMRFYPGNTRDVASNERFHPDTYKSTFDCVAACPGVVYPPWSEVLDESIYQQDDDGVRGDGNGDATLAMSSTLVAAATSTVSAANGDVNVSVAASTTAKPTVTGTAHSAATGGGNSVGASLPGSTTAAAAASSTVHSAAGANDFIVSAPTSLLSLLLGLLMF